MGDPEEGRGRGEKKGGKKGFKFEQERWKMDMGGGAEGLSLLPILYFLAILIEMTNLILPNGHLCLIHV